MTFKDFKAVFTALIPTATVEYGSVGTGYYNVLAIKDGKIICIGEFIRDLWIKSWYTESELLQFAEKCANFYNGVGEFPSWHLRDGRLSF